MATVNITCGHPLHASNTAQPGWNNGVLATADRAVVLWCPGCAAFDQANPSATSLNAQTLLSKAQNALNANANYLAIATPTNAQVAAQVQTLTKECTAIIRLLLNQFDSTAGT